MSPVQPLLVLAGAGKMGGAMLEGWLKLGLDGADVVVIDPAPAAEMLALCEKAGVRVNPPPAGLTPPETLVLAVKPQKLDAAAPALAPLAARETLVVSVIAGKTIADLQARLPHAGAFIRAMPNTPASVGRGITGAACSAAVTGKQRAKAGSLLRAIGQLVWLDDEALIDAVTAVSGSGPAYVFFLAECMAKAGEAAGLPANVAMKLARATVEGAGELLYQAHDVSPAQLRVNVTSPAGTTAAALGVLMADDGLQPLMTRAIAAAKRRAGELAG